MTKLLPTREYFRNNVALRNDTLLGVCEAIGYDLGFNPNFLRVPLAAGIIFAPMTMVGIYLALGVAILAIRILVPDRIEKIAAAKSEAPLTAENNEIELPRAA